MNSLLFDNEIMESLLDVASDILSEHFYKKKFGVSKFLRLARSRLNHTHTEITSFFPKEAKAIFWENDFTKAHFTVDLTLCIFYDILRNDFDFSYEAIYNFGILIMQHITIVEVNE